MHRFKLCTLSAKVHRLLQMIRIWDIPDRLPLWDGPVDSSCRSDGGGENL